MRVHKKQRLVILLTGSPLIKRLTHYTFRCCYIQSYNKKNLSPKHYGLKRQDLLNTNNTISSKLLAYLKNTK